MDNGGLEKDISREPSDDSFSCRNILQPTGIRRIIQNDNGLDRFLLGNYFNILCRISILFWIIFFIQKII
jgi:hypothetical protein